MQCLTGIQIYERGFQHYQPQYAYWRIMSKATKESISGSENIFDRKEIVQKQQHLRKLYQANKDTPGIGYSKIKFRQIIYEVGDYILLESLPPTECYVAKLTKIIRLVDAKEKQEIFIEAEWVMRKNDLPDALIGLYGDYISTAEVFPSNEKIYLYVSSIRSKCTILSIEEYGQISNSPDFIFYSRSRYNVEKRTLEPNPSTWKSDCSCHKPNNPDLMYVQCSKCENWFHQDCVGQNVINGEFLCNGCFGPNGTKGVQQIMDEKW